MPTNPATGMQAPIYADRQIRPLRTDRIKSDRNKDYRNRTDNAGIISPIQTTQPTDQPVPIDPVQTSQRVDMGGVQPAATQPTGLITARPTTTSATSQTTPRVRVAPTQATSVSANAIPLNVTPATTGSPATYQATPVTAKPWEVTPEQTVAGQIQGIIASGSPLMQQAETRAKQEANARGLLSSSMAVGAGQEALIRQALPIASQDASTYGAAGQYAATSADKAAMFNAELGSGASRFAAEAMNQINMEKLSNKNREALAKIAGEYNVASENAAAVGRIRTNLTASIRDVMLDPLISKDSPGPYTVADTQVPPRWQVGDPMPSPADNIIATLTSAANSGLEMYSDIDKLGISDLLTGGTTPPTNTQTNTNTQNNTPAGTTPTGATTSGIAGAVTSTTGGQTPWSSYLNTLPTDIATRIGPNGNLGTQAGWDAARTALLAEDLRGITWFDAPRSGARTLKPEASAALGVRPAA